jgi:hypothetical protein
MSGLQVIVTNSNSRPRQGTALKEHGFSLLGGPLHRVGCRLGLVRGRTNTVMLGLVLGVLPWVVLWVLALIEGLGDAFFSIKVIGGHVRLLVAIPLFFVCESVVDPRMASFVNWTLRARAVAARALPALESDIARINHWKDSWLLEALCLTAAILVRPVVEATAAIGVSTIYDPSRAIAPYGLAAWWWWNVCLTLARFLVLRWFMRLALWSYFLWRVSQLELNLQPNHPDGAAGLAGLETVHRHFLPLILAFSAIGSASFAEELSAGTMAFAAIYPLLAMMFIAVVVLFVGPLLVFTPKLRTARLKGITVYMGFAARYVRDFDHQWLGTSTPEKRLLGSPDIQSLADLGNSASTVRSMRIVPVSRNILMWFAVGVALPMLPLLLFEYPIAQLATMFLKKIVGL